MEKSKRNQQSEADRTGMVQKELTEEEVAAKADELAAQTLRREELAEKKRSHNREWNEQLRQFHERITQLATEIEAGEAWVSAQQQFPGVDPPAKAAKKRRAKKAGA